MTNTTVRTAARERQTLDGADTQVLEAALTTTERELSACTARLAELEGYYLRIAEVCGAVHEQSMGQSLPGTANEVWAAVKALRDAKVRLSDLEELIPRDEWDEDYGNVLWWTVPISEPPYCGTPLDDDFPEFATHWSRLP